MRKIIARLLIVLADKICHEAYVKRVKGIDNYDPKQIGCAWSITPNDIRRFKNQIDEKSTRKALPKLKEKWLLQQRQAILNEAAKLIECSVYKENGETIVESRLNVYVKGETTYETGEE